MRIALVTRRYPPAIGGAEKVLSYLAPALAEQGHEVAVITAMPFDRAEPLPDRERPPTRNGSLAVERLATHPWRFVGTWLYMRNLRSRLDRDPPDLAYVSMLKHDAYEAVGVGQRRGFPVVLRPEGAGQTGDIAWQRWGRFGRKIAGRCRQADAFVALSKSIAGELEADGYDADRIAQLPNGVPIPAQPWNRRPDWREAPRAAFVGRLAKEKGLDTLVDAWEVVRRVHRHALLTLAGDGPERPALEARIAQLDLGDSIRFAGAIDDPTAFLREQDLFVLPSREEGMSIALLEAMALGIPLVATAIPGNRRLVGDFKHGRLTPADHPFLLAQAIVEQWGNFDRALHMGRSARALVARSFSIETMAKQHLELFGAILASRGKTPPRRA
ncbi:MAG: glycosyltransferase family 4 protein [Isosphaeraceae bacterium]